MDLIRRRRTLQNRDHKYPQLLCGNLLKESSFCGLVVLLDLQLGLRSDVISPEDRVQVLLVLWRRWRSRWRNILELFDKIHFYN